LLFKAPWIFPLLIVFGGCYYKSQRQADSSKGEPPKQIKWEISGCLESSFLSPGLPVNWPESETIGLTAAPINLFENTYRFGSLVFGGGQVYDPNDVRTVCRTAYIKRRITKK
jgi:chromate transporter